MAGNTDLDLCLSPLIAVVGATGTGKSELGLRLAETFDGEIVNCDSIQAYRGLDIGSAKLPPHARRGIPHHLIDALSVDQDLTAGEYARMARRVLAEISGNKRLPIIVGGTGFYLRALLDGLSPAPTRNVMLRARLREVGERRPGALHRVLRFRDPAAALRIHPNDRQKLIRALEMIFLAGAPATLVQSAPRDRLKGFAVLKLGLAPDRAALGERLDRRAAAMFGGGLLEETRELLARGVSRDSKPLQSLGYKQAQQVLAGELGVEDAIRECQTKTRQYAKRQMTWFRREPGVEWLQGFGEDAEIQRQAIERVRVFVVVAQFEHADSKRRVSS